MRFSVWLLSLWLAVYPALADSAFVAPTATGTAATGQIPGTTTNDNASAGNVGQYVVASNGENGTGAASVTITVTIASPAVVTWTGTVPYVKDPNSVATCAAINFTTTGALPTGLVAGTVYYVIGASISGQTFQLATSTDNCITGTAINTTGSQSGTHTGVPTALLPTSGKDLASMALPAGDWDVSMDTVFTTGTATSITLLISSLSTSTGAVQNNTTGKFTQWQQPATIPANGGLIGQHVGPFRVSLSGTTTIYCVTFQTFTVGTLTAWGGCRARRIR